MKIKPLIWLVGLALTLAIIGCSSDDGAGASITTEQRDALFTEHMTAEATLTAHYIAAALAAGMTTEQINATLAQIARDTVIAEFWVSDESGNVVFTTVPDVPFTYPTDPEAGTQAAPFASLLTGDKKVVAQGVMARESDGAEFKYVGVAGVDQRRIVQVGVPGSAIGSSAP